VRKRVKGHTIGLHQTTPEWVAVIEFYPELQHLLWLLKKRTSNERAIILKDRAVDALPALGKKSRPGLREATLH